MYVYVEHDFAHEMRTATPSTADNGLTEEQVRHATMQAVEIWNTQSRGPALVYGGTLAAETSVDFCATAPKFPATFIRFHEAASPDTNTIASVGWGGCFPLGSSKLLTFWRNKPGQGNLNWPLGSQGSTFVNTMVHELGHVLNLGHAHEASPPTCNSVMAYTSCGVDSHGRHLGSFDKDCVETWSTAPRWLQGRLRGISSSGSFGGLYTFPYGMKKGFHGADAIRRTSNFAYLAYFDFGTQWSSVSVDGYFSWSGFASLPSSPAYPHIGFLDVGPTIFSPRDFGWSSASNGVRFAFLDDENDANPAIWYNPPYVQYIRTDETQSWSSADANLVDCSVSSGGCISPVALRSHLPIATAWDPLSQRTVLGVVLSKSARFNDGDGRIKLHPGFLSSGNYSHLRGGTLVPGSFGSAWPADASTDQPISLACADGQWPSPYNCIVAWVDKDQYQGGIRYNYFRLTFAGIEFDGDWTTRGGAKTAAGPAVAYVGNQFWLAYRDLTQTTVTYQASSSPYSWYTAGYDGGHFPIVEGPTFMFNHGQEAAVYFASGQP